jgi:hypothetical protein
MSGLKINFAKSEVFCFGKCKDMRESYEDIFTCKSGVLPLKYRGVPLIRKSFLIFIGNRQRIRWRKNWDAGKEKCLIWE